MTGKLVPDYVLTDREKKKREDPHPRVATDMIIEYVQKGQEGLIIITRKYEPHGLALSGGFLEPDLTCLENAIKEVEEETHIQMDRSSVKFFDFYDAVKRDPRKRMVSIVYYGIGTGPYIPDDDADGAHFKTHDEIKQMFGRKLFAFDHEQIIKDYYRRKDEGRL